MTELCHIFTYNQIKFDRIYTFTYVTYTFENQSIIYYVTRTRKMSYIKIHILYVITLKNWSCKSHVELNQRNNTDVICNEIVRNQLRRHGYNILKKKKQQNRCAYKWNHRNA